MSMLSTTKSRNSCLILAILFALLLQGATYGQTILRVDGDDGLASGDGSTWANAYKYLQDAITFARANPGPYHLWVAATDPSNPYVPDRDATNPGGTGSRQSTFLLDFENVQLLGGFLGDETDPDDRDPAIYITVLSGQISELLACGDPAAGDCYEDNGTPGCDDATCCEAVCGFDPDCCEVAWDQDCADLANQICYECGVPGSGDCFDPENGSPTCDDLCDGQECPGCCEIVCDIDLNCCVFDWDDICADHALANCSPPLAGDPPKAYHVVTADGVDDSVRIDGVKITLGLADGAGDNGLGAGMFISNSSPAVVRVIFTENAAPGHGGGAMNIGGASDPLVVNCEFVENTGDEAGALHTEDGSAGGTFVNCLFIDNVSQIEGGAINPGADGDLNFINCTFADNSVVDSDGGGAIFTEAPGDGLVYLTNCILWGNEAGGNPSQINDDAEEEVTVSYSCVEGTIELSWDGGNNINDDPLFFDPVNGNYRLDALSPCIDFGDPDDSVIPDDIFDLDNDNDELEPTPDLDLGDRVVDGDEDMTAVVDMGAYESVPCPWDLNGDCVVGVEDLLIILANWGSPYDIDDFDDLMDAWGPCACDPEAVVPSLADELDDACLTQLDWLRFMRVLDNPPSQAVLDNNLCWMIHYLDHCDQCICLHSGVCPDDDPFE